MLRFRVDLKTFWGFAMPNQLTNASMLSESKYLAGLEVGFSYKEPQTLMTSIYSTTILYDTICNIINCIKLYKQFCIWLYCSVPA